MSNYWNNCYSSRRYGVDKSVKDSRSDYEHDYDRLIFSSAFRRLQNKTQVFPLPGHIFVHNRLTHSLEVASVGRSLGKIVGQSISEFESTRTDKQSENFYRYHLKDVIASACLAHDLGNPAFGHSGEEAISHYFISHQGFHLNNQKLKDLFSDHQWSDLTHFEGNANTLRLLSRQFNGRLQGGNFRLTLSTLSSILKYPCASTQTNKSLGRVHLKKYGYFESEKAVFDEIVEATSMLPDVHHKGAFLRHPFVNLVEAADDICYNVIDFEDAQRLGILTHDYVKDVLTRIVLLSDKENHSRFLSNLKALSQDPNEQITYLRAKVINYLTNRCAEVFVERQSDLADGSFNSSLIECIPEFQSIFEELRDVSINRIYNHDKVVKVEVTGYKIMSGLLEDFIPAVLNTSPSSKDKKLLQLIPHQYHYGTDASDYEKCLSVLDFVSGMTDLYALELYQNLRGIRLPGL